MEPTSVNGNSTTSATATPGVRRDQGICQFTATLNREAFSDILFPRRMPFKLIITGVCHIKPVHYSKRTYGVDALYEEVDPGNYISPHDLLWIDRRQCTRETIEEDRALHRYVLPYKGTGGRLGVLIKIPDDQANNLRGGWATLDGEFEITVASLSAGELADVGLGSKEYQREAERQDQLHRHAVTLAARAHLEQNFLDQGFRERYAAQHLAQILTQEKEQWLGLYRTVLADSDLYALVEQQYTHVLPWIECLLETARIAQRLALQPKDTQKPKLTREQWQARIARYRQRQIDRMRVDADDRIARLLARYEALERLREQAADFGLDAEKIEELEDELEQELKSEGEEDEDTGQGYTQA